MNVAALMSKTVVQIHQNAAPADALELLKKHHFHHLVVVDDSQQLVGMLSYNDLRPLINYLTPNTDVSHSSEPDAVQLYNVGRVKDLMSVHLIHVSPDQNISAVAKILLDQQIHSVPVLENGTLVGILTDTDILRAVANQQLVLP